jgi:hypothetical protein
MKTEMKTNHLIVMIAILGFAFTTGYSQKQHGRLDIDGRIEDHLDKMNEVVQFTGNQRSELQALFNEVAKKKKNAFCANELGSDGMQKAMKSIRKDKDAKLKKILTKDQMKLWKDHIQANHPEGKDKDKHQRKGKSMDDRINTKLDRMNEVVKFTGTQREDLKKLFDDLAKKGKDIACAHELGSDAMKAEMKKLNEERKAGMQKILTDDQVKLWKDHKRSMHDQHKGERENKGKNTRDK